MKAFRYFSLLALFGSACTVGPEYREPEIAAPASWSGAAPAAENPDLRLESWWKTLNDPFLDSLVERAISKNFDLRIAEARILEARALRSAAGANDLPQVDASASYERRGRSENAPGFLSTFGRENNFFEAAFDASWEIDLFGGNRRRIEAADADLTASVENRRDVLVTLVGDLARNYLELRGSERQLETARSNAATAKEIVSLIRSRSDAGLASELDLARAEALASESESAIPALESARKIFSHRLAVLAGESPGSLEIAPAKTIPSPAPDIPAGLPSDLLRRRPDIRRAERELAAETARIGEAESEFYPKFSLTGALGLQSETLSDLLKGRSGFWSFGPKLSLPIFSGGRIQANLDAQQARTQQALAQFEKTVTQALEEVENSLVSYGKEKERYALLARAAQSSRRAADLAKTLYSQGLVDFFNVLEADRTAFRSEDLRIQSEKSAAVHLVSLYKALGGGWGLGKE